PFGYGITYLDRAKTYVKRCDESFANYELKYFIQAGTNLIREPQDARFQSQITAINREMFILNGFQRLAECHELLGDNPTLMAKYDAVVKAAGRECLNGMKHPYTSNGHTVYKWGYFPWTVDPDLD